MKTKIFGGIAIVAIAAAVALNVSISNQKQDKASMLALANVEALADGEINPDCPNGCIDGEPTGCYCKGDYPDLEEYDWN